MNNQDRTKVSPSTSHLPIPSQNLSTTTDTSSSSPVVVPTPSVISEPDEVVLQDDAKMEASPSTDNDPGAVMNHRVDGQEKKGAGANDTKTEIVTMTAKAKADKKKIRSKKKGKRVQESSDSDSDSESSDTENESAESDSEDEKAKRKKKRKLAAKRAAEKKKKQRAKEKEKAKAAKSKKKLAISDVSSSESSSSDSDTEAEVVVARKSRKKASKSKKKKKSKKHNFSSDESDSLSSSSSSSDSDSEDAKPRKKHSRKKHKAAKKSKKIEDTSSSSSESSSAEESAPEAPPEVILTTTGLTEGADLADQISQTSRILLELKQQQAQLGLNTAAIIAKEKAIVPEKKHVSKKNANEYKRIDQVWDNKIRDYKFVESAAEQQDEFDCVFTVRRRFDWEGKHRETLVDIKSKLLKGALQEVFKDCKHISLVEDVPQIDPRTLFHYYREICTYVKKTLKPKLKRAKRSKDKKQLTQQISQCKLLIGYIDKDYSSVRKALKPMLKAGTITYDLVWALFKPNSIVYTPTYGNKDDPRCFKVDFCYEYEDWLSGEKQWQIHGRYMEYDGKVFGLGDHGVNIPSFKGHKKITSLATYPIEYHKDPEGIKKKLIERGKRFVALQGMNYRVQKGIAYMKYKRQVVKFNINGRVMVDPAIFRRINPNYALSYIRQDEVDDEDDSDEEDDCCGDDSDSNDEEGGKPEKMRNVVFKDSKGKKHLIQVPQSQLPDRALGSSSQALDTVVEDGTEARKHVFTEEELLIASPVVLGFSFSEKLWLEFSLSGIKEIEWNNEAFDSLVLPSHIKQNLKGLVSSHRFNAAKTIDDVIQGKGKGLNVVLHGPPGVGKTLTGESIAEYLKCPLYAVSAGELGTNSASLEKDLNRIMDITHSWGAILLLDEADVFLEARQPHDIHRNSLVSVFLRLTEYYQGILFLTTNRVSTFDEAFQSRIHMGIRYENLNAKARKEIWKHHVGKVEKISGESKDEEHKMKPLKDGDFDELSKKAMNGRQIKNAVKTSQSIALAEKEAFSMLHIKRVLDVAEAFEDDMKGGKGYRDAMRQYT